MCEDGYRFSNKIYLLNFFLWFFTANDFGDNDFAGITGIFIFIFGHIKKAQKE